MEYLIEQHVLTILIAHNQAKHVFYKT